MESAAVLEQSPGVFVKIWQDLTHLLGRVSAAGMTLWSLFLAETIKGWNTRASVVWKQQIIFLESS